MTTDTRRGDRFHTPRSAAERFRPTQLERERVKREKVIEELADLVVDVLWDVPGVRGRVNEATLGGDTWATLFAAAERFGAERPRD